MFPSFALEASNSYSACHTRRIAVASTVRVPSSHDEATCSFCCHRGTCYLARLRCKLHEVLVVAVVVGSSYSATAYYLQCSYGLQEAY